MLIIYCFTFPFGYHISSSYHLASAYQYPESLMSSDICISASPPSFKLAGSLCFQFTACWSVHTALQSEQIPHDGFIFLFLSIYFFLHITCSLYSVCGDKFFGCYQTIRDSLKDPYPLYKNSDHYAPLVICRQQCSSYVLLDTIVNYVPQSIVHHAQCTYFQYKYTIQLDK